MRDRKTNSTNKVATQSQQGDPGPPAQRHNFEKRGKTSTIIQFLPILQRALFRRHNDCAQVLQASELVEKTRGASSTVAPITLRLHRNSYEGEIRPRNPRGNIYG